MVKIRPSKCICLFFSHLCRENILQFFLVCISFTKFGINCQKCSVYYQLFEIECVNSYFKLMCFFSCFFCSPPHCCAMIYAFLPVREHLANFAEKYSCFQHALAVHCSQSDSWKCVPIFLFFSPSLLVPCRREKLQAIIRDLQVKMFRLESPDVQGVCNVFFFITT